MTYYGITIAIYKELRILKETICRAMF